MNIRKRRTTIGCSSFFVFNFNKSFVNLVEKYDKSILKKQTHKTMVARYCPLVLGGGDNFARRG